MGSASADPVLTFQHIYQTESCCDEGWVEISSPATGGWVKLGSAGSGTNWYNDTYDDVWNGSSGTAGAWRTASHPLADTAGQRLVRIRFAFSSDGSITNEGFGVDDVRITP